MKKAGTGGLLDARTTAMYQRVQMVAGRSAREQAILAHVLAHEIGHVLQVTNQHAQAGVMKTNWNGRDYDAMEKKPLEFTHDDIDLIVWGLTTRRAQKAGADHAQTPAIPVHVVDNYGVPKFVIAAAQRDSTHILAVAGVKLDWRQGPAPGGLTLYLVASRGIAGGGDTLGYTLIDPASIDGNNYARLLYPAIERVAQEWQAGVSTVLGAAIAHEIGHILLNSGAHSDSGVMIAHFRHLQIAQARKGELYFTSEQAAHIRSQVERRYSSRPR